MIQWVLLSLAVRHYTRLICVAIGLSLRLPRLSLLEHILNIILTLSLLTGAALWRKAGRDGHFDSALLLQLFETSLLLDISYTPLLKVFHPRSGAVLFEFGRLGGAGFARRRDARLLGCVNDVVGVQAGKVGVAGGPADLTLVAGGNGFAGTDGVPAGFAGKWPPAHVDDDVCEEVEVVEEGCCLKVGHKQSIEGVRIAIPTIVER